MMERLFVGGEGGGGGVGRGLRPALSHIDKEQKFWAA